VNIPKVSIWDILRHLAAPSIERLAIQSEDFRSRRHITFRMREDAGDVAGLEVAQRGKVVAESPGVRGRARVGQQQIARIDDWIGRQGK